MILILKSKSCPSLIILCIKFKSQFRQVKQPGTGANKLTGPGGSVAISHISYRLLSTRMKQMLYSNIKQFLIFYKVDLFCC